MLQVDDLAYTMLSEVNPSQKDKSCAVPLHDVPRAGKSMEAESRLVGAGGGGGEGALVFNGDRVSVWQDEEIL